MSEKQVTRVRDLSIGVCSVGLECCPHAWISTHVQGSPDTITNNQQNMRVGDIGISTCPHCVISYAITGSSLTFINAKKTHRVSDVHIVPCGTGVCITGSPDTFSE